MWWWVLGQLPFLPFDLGLGSLKVSSEWKVYVCNHAFHFFKFHGILRQQVSITLTFDPHVGTLVIVFGLSCKVFFHNHRIASDCQELLSCCRCQLLVIFVFNVHYCYCYQYHTPNGVQHHCHDRHHHSCHFHSCRSSDPHFPPSYLLSTTYTWQQQLSCWWPKVSQALPTRRHLPLLCNAALITSTAGQHRALSHCLAGVDSRCLVLSSFLVGVAQPTGWKGTTSSTKRKENDPTETINNNRDPILFSFLCRRCSTHWMAGNNIVYSRTKRERSNGNNQQQQGSYYLFAPL